MCSLTLLGVLCVVFLLYILCVTSFALSLTLSLALSLVRLPFLLWFNRSAHFSLYIVDLDQQLYVELVINQYRCLVSLI